MLFCFDKVKISHLFPEVTSSVGWEGYKMSDRYAILQRQIPWDATKVRVGCTLSRKLQAAFGV